MRRHGRIGRIGRIGSWLHPLYRGEVGFSEGRPRRSIGLVNPATGAGCEFTSVIFEQIAAAPQRVAKLRHNMMDRILRCTDVRQIRHLAADVADLETTLPRSSCATCRRPASACGAAVPARAGDGCFKSDRSERL